MATVLYLNDTQVYPTSGQNIKLTRENPYFTLSGSYTLDVTLPMDILENRRFFGSIHRMEVRKRTERMTCRLLVDNRQLLSGSATVTQVTEKEVKVQLLGGNSEINFLSEDGGVYIDEVEYRFSRVISARTYMHYMHQGADTFDWYCQTQTPRLVDIISEVLWACGYTVTENFLDREPWNRLYVAAYWQDPLNFAGMLPHWKASEFFREVGNLFNVTFKADPVDRTVRILSNMEYTETAGQVVPDVVDEYTAELTGTGDEAEVEALANVNLAYSLTSSEYHDLDCLDSGVRDALEKKQYDTYVELRDAWYAMDSAERSRYLFVCPGGCYASWVRTPLTYGEEKKERLTYIDCFRPLTRNNLGEYGQRDLRIVPVAMASTGAFLEHWQLYEHFHMPHTDDGPAFTQRTETGGTEVMTVQEAVEYSSSAEEEEDTADVIEVMFVDDVEQIIRKTTTNSSYTSEETGVVGFTDWLLKPGLDGALHRRWSLSLNPTNADHYIGELHQNPYTLDTKARLCVKFLADTIPDSTDVFLIRGKRYACEKIEASIRDGRLDRLMTGYFYEFL